MTFALTASQARVVGYVREKLSVGRPLLIQGAAGTGKTTLINELLCDGATAYLSYTGKAVSVLRQKVDDPQPLRFSTLHGAVMAPEIKDPVRYDELLRSLPLAATAFEAQAIEAELSALEVNPNWVLQDSFVWDRIALRKQRQDADWGEHPAMPTLARLLVIDEASMVPDSIGQQIMDIARRDGTEVIALGDFNQLPPVGKEPAFFRPENCDCAPEMVDIVRQSEGSPIINLAWCVRLGIVSTGEYPAEFRKSRKEGLPRGWDHRQDQIICGKNKTRDAVNAAYREPGRVRAGDKMIVLKNNHKLGICNGDVFFVTSIDDAGQICGEFSDGRKLWKRLVLEPASGAPCPRLRPDEIYAGFAYAITCHKAQGSEWPNVWVLDESSVFREQAGKWLYTAVTRARQGLTLQI